jgi:hypothetical protein
MSKIGVGKAEAKGKITIERGCVSPIFRASIDAGLL